MLCEYGCGQEAFFSPRLGIKKWCCSDNWRKCLSKRTYKNLTIFEINKIKLSVDIIKEIDEKSFDVLNRQKTRRILVKCIECGKVREMALSDFLVCKTNFCKSCGKKGERNVSKRKDVRIKLSRKGVKDTGYATPQWRDNFSKKRMGRGNPMFGKKRTERAKKLTSLAHKKNFLDKEFCLEFGRRFNHKPNKPETIVNDLLKTIYDNKYLYTGNFKIFIGGRNPDFINENNKKIIEMFGTYWHSKTHTGVDENESCETRINHFKKYGYETLIIWENELKNIDGLVEKIVTFDNEVKNER
jgi:G:T-mismatch repair DNA endonuclease (very short patch repair protein)